MAVIQAPVANVTFTVNGHSYTSGQDGQFTVTDAADLILLRAMGLGSPSNAAAPPSPTVLRSQGQSASRSLIAATNFTALAAKRADANTVDVGRLKLTFGRAGYHSLRVAFGNFYSATGEQADLDTITVQAALELTSPARVRPFNFGTARSLSLAAGDVAWSGVLPAEVTGAEVAWLRSYLSVASVVSGWPVWRTPRATGEAFLQSAGGTNQTVGTGPMVSTGTTSGQGFAPLALVGEPLPSSPLAYRRAVICDGDSIMAGTGDTADATTGSIAYSKALLDAQGYQIPFVNQGRASDQLSFQVDGATYSRWRKTQLWPFATHYLTNFGTNDVASSRTLQNMQDDATYLWTRAKKYGLHVTHMKILPRTTTQTSGVPVAGFAAGGVRSQFNAWLSTQVGNGLLDAVIDCNPLVESAVTPGTWGNTSQTVDGIHMNAAGYAQANPAVQAWVLAQVAV